MRSALKQAQALVYVGVDKCVYIKVLSKGCCSLIQFDLIFGKLTAFAGIYWGHLEKVCLFERTFSSCHGISNEKTRTFHLYEMSRVAKAASINIYR